MNMENRSAHSDLNGPRNTVAPIRSKHAVHKFAVPRSPAVSRSPPRQQLPDQVDRRQGDMANTCTEEMIAALERQLGEKLNWKTPPRDKSDWKPSDDESDGEGSVYTSGYETDSCSSDNFVEQPWCFVLVQPGMADRWKLMCPKEATRLWVYDPEYPGHWFRVPVARVQSSIRCMQPLVTSFSQMVGVYFRRAARLMSCYLVGNPSWPETWLEIQCQPELQSPDSQEHVFAHLLTQRNTLDFRILEFGAVENPRTGAVTIRVATHIISVGRWVTGPEMTTAGRIAQDPGPSRPPAVRNVAQFISSCVKGRIVYIAIVTPPSGQQRGLVQVWMYSWEQKAFAQHITAMGWRNDPELGKAMWETFHILFDYDSETLKIWAGWTEDELYTGEVDRTAKWIVRRFGNLKLDDVALEWVPEWKEEGSKFLDADVYFSQPCYVSGWRRDVQVFPNCNGDYVSSRKSNHGELGFDDSQRPCQLLYPPDDYLSSLGTEKAAECVCIGSFWPTPKDIRHIEYLHLDPEEDDVLPPTPQSIHIKDHNTDKTRRRGNM